MKKKKIIAISVILILIIFVGIILIFINKKEIKTECEAKKLEFKNNIVKYKIACNDKNNFISVSYSIDNESDVHDLGNEMKGEFSLKILPKEKINLYYYYDPECNEDSENCDVVFGTSTLKIKKN